MAALPEAMSYAGSTQMPELWGVFGEDWPERPPELRVRAESAADLPLLCAMFASTRAQELQLTGWSVPQQQAFLQQQFDAQRAHYQQHYVGAALQVIEWQDTPIGRIYLHRGRAELRLMELTLLPEWRGQGIARGLLLRLIGWCDARDLPISLHVEPFNPARAWYQRLGFRSVEQRGIYEFMQRDPA